MKKVLRFTIWLFVVVPYIAVVGGADLVRELWREA
jgi:hypothetical protein